MLPIQSGYLSYQLAPRTQGQRAEQTEEVCRFDKLDKVQLLMIMEKLNDEDRVSFIMSCKKTYKVYKEAVVSNPELNPRILLMARRDRNVAHRAIDEFKKYSICQQAVFTATFGFADLAFCLVCSSTGCCCCTPSAAVTLGLQITSGVFCGLGCLSSFGFCCTPHNNRLGDKLVETYNNADKKLHQIKTNRGIESHPQPIKMEALEAYKTHWGNSDNCDTPVWN